MSEQAERTRCTWEGCWRSSAQPFADGWASLAGWGPAVKDGLYCKQHAAALEQVEMDGGFDEAAE